MTKRTWHELDSDIDYHSYTPLPKKSCKSWNCIYCDANNHESLNTCKSCKSWKCINRSCKIINPQYENICTHCKTNKSNRSQPTANPVSQWRCTRCTLDNDNNRHICEICNTPKPIKKKTKPKINIPKLPDLESISVTYTWKCKTCTYKNNMNTNTCTMCNKPKQPIQQLPPSTWQCKNCTMINNLSNRCCEICAERNPINIPESVSIECKQMDSLNINNNNSNNKNISNRKMDTMSLAKRELKRFGHKTFRESQYPVIEKLITGKNTMLILPTGGGKSLCFQIPILVLNHLCNKQQKYGKIQKGIGIVISPLISLMNDQIQKLRARNIDAVYINSSLRQSERRAIENRLKNNEIEMLYCAPELLSSNSNKIVDLLLTHRIITLFVIDEAHCISEWGHNFRPSYTKLGRIRDTLNDPVTMVCTATATQRVRIDILNQLDLNTNNCAIHIGSFDRPNIYIKCIQKRGNNIHNIMRNEIEKYQRQNGTNNSVIIYCGTKTNTDKTAQNLQQLMKNSSNKIAAYHAGIADRQRETVQNDFINGNINIIAATNAFGMGIDKDNVGLVIHQASCASIEEYYQQIGRAGRNGQNSIAVSIISNGKYDNSEWLVQMDNPTNDVIKTVAKVICNNYRINEQKPLKTKLIFSQTGYNSYNDNVNEATVSACVKIFENYKILKKIKSDFLPVIVTFLNGGKQNMRQNTNGWKLWNEISNKPRNGNNQIEIITFKMAKKLQIVKKELTKALQSLKNKKLLNYSSLKRSCAIILLTNDWERKIDWNEVRMNRENAIQNEKKMRRLLKVNGCRRKFLLKHFDQNYIVGSNQRCCDNCNSSYYY